jgi:hypothetical protein
LAEHHTLFTYGANVNQPGCAMPTSGVRWLPTRQPVVLDMWPVVPAPAAAPFTTVMNWSTLPDTWHEGRVYGQKDREFEPFLTLPRESAEAMKIAVSCEPKFCDPQAVRQRLLAGGWRLADDIQVSRDPWTYQRFIQGSRAEFSVAKHGYVITRCGWFSERSANYLASGRPVLVQDTGFTDWLPAGSGVFAFQNRGEALAGIEAIKTRYDFHCREARAIAEEYFAAPKVLSQLLEQAVSG